MKARHATGSPRLARALLRVAAQLAPADVRREWQREWAAEIDCYAHRRAALPSRVTLRTIGAFAHAAWLRWDRWRLEMLMQDVKYALRTLTRKPGYAAVTVLTLAIGIGANAAMFSAVRAVLLRPLPFPEPQQLLHISSTSTLNPRVPFGTASPPDFVDWRRQNSTLQEIAAVNAGSIPWSGHGAAEQVPYAMVTGGFFDVMATAPLYGRAIGDEDDSLGAPDVVVLSHALWTRRLASDPAIVGKTMTLDGTPRRIVGVMPAGFEYPLGSELWVPLRFTERDLTTQRGAHYLDVVARRKPGVSLEAVQADLSQIVSRLAQEYPSSNGNKAVAVFGLRDALVGDLRPAMLMLLGAVGFVLLIVCVNVASLSLTRAVGRTRELAVRMAIGAGRARLISGLFVESMLLAGAGGAAGLLLAVWTAQAIARMDTAVGVPLLDRTSVDAPVVLFTIALAAFAAVLFGILPAWHASSVRNVAHRIREDAGTLTGGSERRRLRNALIVAETALAVVLLVGAGLLMRSFFAMTSVDLGFDTTRVQTFSLSLPEAKYGTPPARAAFVDTLLARLRAHPDVETAAAVFGLPLTRFTYLITTSTIDGRRLTDEEQDARSLQVRVMTPDYFRTLGIPLLRGRTFEPGDRLGSPTVAILNETAARLLWPGEDAIGHELRLGTRLGQGGESVGGTVIGIARDVREYGPARRVPPTIYVAHAQFPVDFLAVVMKARRDPAALVEPSRTLLQTFDPDLPMFRVRSMEQLAAGLVAQPRLYMLLLGFFALAAVLLAAIGIYGVLMHAVSQRTREIGVRLALGAGRAEVVGMVVRHATLLALGGLAIGLAAAYAASGAIERLLFSVPPVDPVTYGAVSAGLLLVAMFAAYLPARRASRIDPIRALRYE